jgi:hypothetical protein
MTAHWGSARRRAALPCAERMAVRLTSKRGCGSSLGSVAIFSGWVVARCCDRTAEVSRPCFCALVESRTYLEGERKVVEPAARLAFRQAEQADKVLNSDVGPAHRVRLPPERMLDKELRLGPGRGAVDDERLFQATRREGLLQRNAVETIVRDESAMSASKAAPRK